MNRTLLAAAVLLLAAAPALAQEPPPTIGTVTPSSGPTAGGTLVTITGTGFADPMDVTFGGAAAAAVTVVSPAELQAMTPPHARGAVDVVVSRTAPPPPASSNPAVGAFTYVAPPCRLWVPRAAGSATGGNPGGLDVTIVDAANRAVEASLDLNASDAALPTDDDWRVTQVLFTPSGDWAFLGTAGTPGRLDSRKVFVVKTARALGDEEGAPVVATLDTGGNPYRLALSADSRTLYVSDGGSWKGSSSSLPNGTFRAYDVTDPAAPVQRGTTLTLGILPVLAFDSSAYRRWGTNSSFPGLVQSKDGVCVVTNAGSHTVSLVNLANPGAGDALDAGVPEGGPLQASVSIPSPYLDDFVFVQTTEYSLSFTPQETAYFLCRISTGTLIEKGLVSLPMRFFQAIPSLDLQNRQAWPHPDGQSLVAVPASGNSVVSWNPATGGASSRTAVGGSGPPASLAFNDVTGLYYARHDTGGWTVLSAPSSRGAAPVVVATVPDATGVNSLGVFGTGAELAGTSTSSLAIVDGNPSSPTAHTVVATVALPLNPAGGAVHPQPDAAAGAARVFVTPAPPPSVPRITFPIAGTEFSAGDPPQGFEFDPGDVLTDLFEVEMGTQPDFLTGPGAGRVVFRIPRGETSGVTPPRGAWRRILRAAAGDGPRPLFLRVNAVPPVGERVPGEILVLGVAAPVPPEALSPANGTPGTAEDPPEFSFLPKAAGRFWLEFLDGTGERLLGRRRVGVGTTPYVAVAVFPRAGFWRDVVARAGGDVLWRVRAVDGFGREVLSETRRIVLTE